MCKQETEESNYSDLNMKIRAQLLDIFFHLEVHNKAIVM